MAVISRLIGAETLAVNGWLTGLVPVAMRAVERAVGAQDGVMEVAAASVEDRARHKLGIYQPAVGPYEAWQELSTSTNNPNDTPLLRERQLYQDITHNVTHEGDKTVAYIGIRADAASAPYAAAMELGTLVIGGNTPPRSYLGASAFELQGDIVAAIRSSYALAIDDNVRAGFGAYLS